MNGYELDNIARQARLRTIERLRQRFEEDAFATVTHEAKPALFGNANNASVAITTLKWPSHEIRRRVMAALDEEARS